MPKRTFKRSISIILLFIVVFFAVYVPPMEPVHAFAITASLMLGAAALLTATGIYAINADAINTACTAFLNKMYQDSIELWNFFNMTTAVGKVVVTHALSNYVDTFKIDLFNGDVEIVQPEPNYDIQWNTFYNVNYSGSYFNFTIDGKYNTSTSSVTKIYFHFLDGKYLSIPCYGTGSLSFYNSNGIVEHVFTGYNYLSLNRIYFDSITSTWHLLLNTDYDYDLGVSEAFSRQTSIAGTVFGEFAGLFGNITDLLQDIPVVNYTIDDTISSSTKIGNIIDSTKTKTVFGVSVTTSFV